MQLQPLTLANMIGEENTDLTLRLQCGEETVAFINPYPKRGSPFSCNTLFETAMTASHNGRDIVSNPLEGKLEFDFAASCGSVRREISDLDAVSCRGGREESDELIRPETPRKKLRLSKYQSTILEESFKEHFTLSPKLKSALANKLNLQPRQVEVWFQNRRARTKLKQKEVECENLKRCCKSLREENKRLEIELQALRARKIEQGDLYAQPPNSMVLAAPNSLMLSPSCERLATTTTTTTMT